MKLLLLLFALLTACALPPDTDTDQAPETTDDMRTPNLPIPGAPNPVQVSQASQQATVAITDDYEFAAKYVNVLMSKVRPFAEVAAFETTRRWQGVDVYLTPTLDGMAANEFGIITVYVWAIMEGGRILVATGRYKNLGTGGGEPPAARLVVQARAISARFAVTLSYSGTSGANPAPGGSVLVYVVATDNCTDADPAVGVVPIARQVSIGSTLSGILEKAPSAKLVGITATLSDTSMPLGAYWVQVHELQAVNSLPVANAVPLLSYPLTFAAGLNITNINLRVVSPGGHFAIVASVDPGQYVASATPLIQAYVQ